MSFAARTAVLREAFNDPKYGAKLEKAKTFKELTQVLLEFCRERRYRIKTLDDAE